MQRINREREILAQERSIAAAKDAAVMSFLQKIAEQQNLGQALTNINLVQPQPQLQPQPPVQQQVTPPNIVPAPMQQPLPVIVTQPVVLPVVSQVTNMEIMKADTFISLSKKSFHLRFLLRLLSNVSSEEVEEEEVELEKVSVGKESGGVGFDGGGKLVGFDGG